MTDAELDAIIAKILIREGGWSDRPNDRGGPTNRGITLAQWTIYCEDTGQPERATKGSLKASTREDAFAFYRWYIRRSGVLEMGIYPESLAQVIDMVVHHRRWKAILDDAHGNVEMAMIGMARIRYMAEVVQKDPQQKEFFYGWVIRALEAAGWWPRAKDTREA